MSNMSRKSADNCYVCGKRVNGSCKGVATISHDRVENIKCKGLEFLHEECVEERINQLSNEAKIISIEEFKWNYKKKEYIEVTK